MPTITNEDLAPFTKLKIIKSKDFQALSVISRKLKLKQDEKGFSPNAMRNFTYGSTCSEKTKEAILNYFQAKLLNLKKEVDRVCG